MYKIFDKQVIGDITKNITTPCYIYDAALLVDTIKHALNSSRNHSNYDIQIHYALKANNNKDVLQIIRQHGINVDCVSGGEIELALANGFLGNQIVFAGVGKQDCEILLGLNANIHCFNCESIQEIQVINDLAAQLSKVANISIRINPGIDPHTHKNITTGTHHNKFGIHFDDLLSILPLLLKSPNIKLIGLHYHVGSQITTMDTFSQLAHVAHKHYQILNNHNIKLTEINLGGGLGIDYDNPHDNPLPNFTDYFANLVNNLNLPDVKIRVELGRSLVAQCGGILTSVIFTKNILNKHFAIVDVGMNDFMRPALYNVHHSIIPLVKSSLKQIKYTVVGPICESTDTLAIDLSLPILHRYDRLIILSTGAYGKVLANTYNSRPLICEYII
jgi:diaminopimelate decarboxylase